MILRNFAKVYIFLTALTFFLMMTLIGKSSVYHTEHRVTKRLALQSWVVNKTDATENEPEILSPLPQLSYPNYNWMKPIDYSYSHPLENKCRYPVLNKQETDLAPHVFHHRTFNCSSLSPPKIGVHQGKNGEMYIHQLQDKKGSYKCYAAKLVGALKPLANTFNIEKYFEVPIEKPFIVGYDQFVLECYPANMSIVNTTLPKIFKVVAGYQKIQQAVYQNAFNWVLPKPSVKPPSSNVPYKYSIVILALESTSRTQFLRHMPLTFKIMQDLGFNFFSGFNKVGDNSLINLNTVLTGRVFSAKERGFEDIISNDTEIQVDLEGIETYRSAIYSRAKKGGYATMWNDEVGLKGFGLYQYFKWTGFRKPIAHYYYRLFYQYLYNVLDAFDLMCDNDGPLAPRYLRTMSAFSTRYANKTHFSFNFVTRLTHEEPNNLELYDISLSEVLKDFKVAGVFDNTVVVIMGDHGNRINDIQKTYSGRIEERSPFLGLYLPTKFAIEHPEKVKNLKVNQNRLVSHFDLFETLSDVLDISLSEPKHPQTVNHGTSLFEEISVDRDCNAALIPSNFCLCMEDPRNSTDQNITTTNYRIRLNQTLDTYFHNLTTMTPCIANISIDNVTDPKLWTISTMARSGVRALGDKWTPVKREAAELELTSNINVRSTDGTVLKGEAKMRLFWLPTFDQMEINVAPHVTFDSCPGVFVLNNVCQCYV